MNKKQKKKLDRIIATIIVYIIVVLFFEFVIKDENIIAFGTNISNFLNIILYFIPYIIVGYDVIKKGIKRVKRGLAFDECVLMTLATIGAFIIGEYREAVFVMLFYQIGEFFQDYAMGKSEKNLEELLSIKSDYANLYIDDNNIKTVNPSEIIIGSIIIVKNGERVPIDGVVYEGNTLLNTSAITGESIPKQVKVSDEVLSGMINTEGVIKVKTTKLYDDSAASKIVEMVKNASNKKSKSENFITSFAKVYTPIVCLLALMVFVLPSLYNLIILHKNLITDGVLRLWLYRALTMLVISCPCALIVSIPLAFFSSIGRASRYGILIKGTNYLDTLSKVKTIAFDKTGTMTKGVFEIVVVHNEENYTVNEIIELASYVEYYSNHPIAKCIKKEYKKVIDTNKIKDCKEIGGYGLEAYVDGDLILVGSSKLMKENGVDFKECDHMGTIVHVARNKNYLGHIVISDIIKEEAKASVDRLKKIGINDIIMLTGDTKEVGNEVAKKIGIEKIYTDLLPSDKLSYIEDLMNKSANGDKKIAFVGDGINDAPVLVRSDVGISMGSIGSDSAIEASDVVIMDDNPIKISTVIKIARKTMLINYEIIIFTILIKILFIILSAIGISNMWLSIFADVGVMIICVINAARLMVIKYD